MKFIPVLVDLGFRSLFLFALFGDRVMLVAARRGQ
jgi:hypothetical protein